MKQQDNKVKAEVSLDEAALIVRGLENLGDPESLALAGRLSRWLAQVEADRAAFAAFLASVGGRLD